MTKERNEAKGERIIAELKILVCSQQGGEKCAVCEEDQAILVYEGVYEPGDRIRFETNETETYYVIRVDGAMDEAYVYLTLPAVEYEIPFHEKKISYNPAAFTGERHYITMKKAEGYENCGWRNLAKNVMDQQKDVGCYPHAHANVETRGEAVFAARNCLDGVLANRSHGAWPYESWGINQQDDAEITVEFGRPVDIGQLRLYTRADFPHDNWWTQVTVSFSDGSEEVLEMKKSVKPHSFVVKKEKILWLKFSRLVQADDLSLFPALTQIEVYGKNSDDIYLHEKNEEGVNEKA